MELQTGYCYTLITRVHSACLDRFCKQHKFKAQDSPHPYTTPKYGRTTQFAPNIPETSEISANDNNFLEQVLGTLLYYALTINCTMVVTINSIAVNKKYGMKATMDAITQLLDYAATHLDAKVTFHKSNMILKYTPTRHTCLNMVHGVA